VAIVKNKPPAPFRFIFWKHALMTRAIVALFFLAGFNSLTAAERLNLLIITVDDLSADSIGAFGCKLAGTSPNVDQLAKQGLRFERAHVQVGNCMPSRNVMWSGRYPHNNRVEGFYQIKNPGYPVLVDLLKAAGYYTAIRGKVSHSTPYSPYAWDVVLETLPDGSAAHPKDPASYRASTEQGIAGAKQAGKPFCLILNIMDPHKPFYAEGRGGETVPDPHQPSRVFTPDEVPIPGYLFDDPVVRKELAHYYSSVRRADDSVGQIMAALEASGQAGKTVVMFLADHGMPLPFVKTQLYHHSTRTPWIVRWPGVTKAATSDSEHMISAVDMLPTLLDIAGVPPPTGLDGRSFAPLLKGEKQADRNMVIKEYNENAGGSRDPMRAIQTKQFLYIFNPWSNGQRIMQTATTGTPTYRRFRDLASKDPQLAARHKLYQHRVVEELYDVERDPDCLRNLIDDPGSAGERNKLRQALDGWMVKTADPMLEVFRKRDDAAFRELYMQTMEREAAERTATGARKAKKNAKGKGKAKAARETKEVCS
jgi:N-sulfoglucosamine sulfohydrolase